MKALIYKGNEKLEVVEVPKPTPKDGELLLKIKACGICGSDVHGWLGLTERRIPPVVMGHEFTAEIEGFGKGCTSGLALGELVAVQPCMSCGICEYCRKGNNNNCPSRRYLGGMDCNGAFQEYLCVPEKYAYKLPDSISPRIGTLIEVFSVSQSAVKKAGSLSGKNVVIIGGGTVGLMALIAAKLQKPNKILLTELSPMRLEIAKKLGADVAISPLNNDLITEVKSAFNGELADVSIESVGLDITAKQSLEILKPQGCSIWIGLSDKMVEMDMQRIVDKELKILGSYAFTHDEFGESIDLIQKHALDLDMFISNEVTLSEAEDMFKALAEDAEKYLKCIVIF